MDGVTEKPAQATIAGALVATTKEIRQIAKRALEQEREFYLTPDFIKGLDPDGFHILCTRHPAAGERELREQPIKIDMTLGSWIPFEGLFKRVGQEAPSKRWITLTVAEALALEPVDDKKSVQFQIVDAETQLR